MDNKKRLAAIKKHFPDDLEAKWILPDMTAVRGGCAVQAWASVSPMIHPLHGITMGAAILKQVGPFNKDIAQLVVSPEGSTAVYDPKNGPRLWRVA